MCVAFCLSKTIHNLHYEQIGKEVRCIEDELPFEIPDSWECVRLDKLGIYKKGPFGSALTKSMFVPKSDNSIKVYEQKNAIQKNWKLGDYYISKKYYFEKMQSFTVNPGDIIVSCAGTIGETYIMPFNIEAGIINQALMKMTISRNINVDYFLLVFNNIMKSVSTKNSKGSAIKKIPPFSILKQIIVPIPPREEQERIINKINELVPLIESYKQSEEQLYELNSSIKEQLKKSILQYAIEGKLVPQDPNDEPASVLLERIRKEKEKLIAEGKIKKDKNESMIYRRDNSYYEKLGDIETCINDKLPYDLPASWSWCNVGNLFTNSTGLSYKKDQLNKKSNSMVRVLRGGNILEGNYILNSDDVFISSEFVNDNLYLKKGYMITPAVTSLEHIGKIALIDKDYDNIVVGGFVLMLKPVFKCHILIEYLLLFFSTNYYREECRKITHKSGQAFYNLSRDKLMKLYIAIPPLNEQKQIVDKYYQISRLFVL